MADNVRCVTICSSSKFYETAKEVASRLEGGGMKVFTPRFDFDETRTHVGRERKALLTIEFLNKVRACDAVYVVARDGYIGRSVALEVGYATALEKPVYLSQQASEDAIKAITTGIIGADTVSAESFRPTSRGELERAA